MEKSTWVRDTLIKKDKFDLLPMDRQQQITDLITEFKKLGYIDARTEIGPSQFARMSKRQKSSISDKSLKAFNMESQIKLLLRTDDEINEDNLRNEMKKKNSRVQSIQNQLSTLEKYCSSKLASKRNNATKIAYQELKKELTALQQ